MTELTNPRSERVKAARALSGRSARSRADRFLVEGPQGVREAVSWASDRITDLYVAPSALERYVDVVDLARARDVRVHEASQEVLEALSPDAQGMLAVLRRWQRGPRALLDALGRAPRLVAVMSNVRDPGNAGTIIRAADAAGADLVVLAGESVDLYNPKLVRSTAGSLFHLPVVEDVPLPEAVDAIRGAGIQVLAADGSAELDLDDLLDRSGDSSPTPDLARSTAWVFGNEAWGLRDDERALADAAVRVPLRGRAESLNLATAATVCLYASSRAQR